MVTSVTELCNLPFYSLATFLSHTLCTWCGAASLPEYHLSEDAVEVPGDLYGVLDVYM